jgi:hypothetical protein
MTPEDFLDTAASSAAIAEDSPVWSAPSYTGPFDPYPVLSVDGLDVASGPSDPRADGTANAGLMVVDGLSITWGRDDVLGQPVPATGTVSIFDPTRTWATTRDRRGREVQVRYYGLHPVTGAGFGDVIFRGRIGSPVRVSPKTVRHPDTGETIRGALVELPLQSREVDLGNIVPRSGFSAETLGARVDRLVALAQAYGLLALGANIRDYWKTPMVAAVAGKDQVSLLEHFSACFDSAGGDSWTYRPDADSIVYVPRRNYETVFSTAVLWRETTGPRANQGAFIRARDQAFGAGDTQSALGLHLESGALEYDPADGVTSPARVTRVAISHPTENDNTTTRTVEMVVRREPWDPDGGSAALEDGRLGVRTARVDSVVANNSFADQALSDAEILVRREGSRWLLGSLRLDTRKVGGFESVEVGRLLLACYERNDVLFLQRSLLPSLGLRPVVGVMGGTVAYSDGGWQVDLTPAPITTALPQHSLTWEDLNTTDPALRLKAWDAPHPEGMDPTVTWEDLRYVGRGLDAITLPESTRDEYQA